MKNVLITGASKGIGKSTALLFAKKGYNVVINFNTDFDGAQMAARECESFGVSAIAIEGDISISDQVLKIVQVAEKEIGNIDILVNNAGISLQKLFQDTSEEEWDKIFNVNVKGAYLFSKYLLPHMIKQKSGCIINVSSIWGKVGASCEVCYSASKAALIGMTKALAKEVGPSGIRVNCVAPGVVKTQMTECFSKEALEELKEDISLGYIASPEEIAKSIVFLASDDASYITGQVLGVNGGFLS